MSDLRFDADRHPGAPRILFIGWPESSHTHSWIDLLQDAPFNVRLFALPSAVPPEPWPVPTYVTWAGARLDTPVRRSVFPPADASTLVAIYRDYRARGMIAGERTARWLDRAAKLIEGRIRGAATVEAALADVIRTWRPDIVHTLGFDPASYFYLRTCDQFGLRGTSRWVAQARGGPDIALQRFEPTARDQIQSVLAACDHFIADNAINYALAEEMGLDPAKARDPGMGVVSGPGGIDIEALAAMGPLPPSQRERVIVWPKAYETTTAKAMPVFEALLTVWDRIQPCRIEMLWLVQPDVRIWYEKLFSPAQKEACPTFGRLSREETLQRMAAARVMIAPSLSDGIPNTLMEAMALGAAPLVSPLDTIVPVVDDPVNVLFARNLYPGEIADALVRLMSDDALVDRMAAENRRHIRQLADRNVVRARALAFYTEVAARQQQQAGSR
jgi:glycosyltransferase involved in cell wall biosynthesis